MDRNLRLSQKKELREVMSQLVVLFYAHVHMATAIKVNGQNKDTIGAQNAHHFAHSLLDSPGFGNVLKDTDTVHAVCCPVAERKLAIANGMKLDCARLLGDQLLCAVDI